MATARYVNLVAGKLKQIVASVTSTPDAIVAMDATGRIDPGVLPVGVGAETLTVASSENLAGGDFVNLWNSSGAKVRKADATTAGKVAHGFVLAAVTAPANATVYLPSQTNTGLTGLTVGADCYLSTTPGLATATPPSGAGNVVQYLGTAHSTSAMVFVESPTIELA